MIPGEPVAWRPGTGHRTRQARVRHATLFASYYVIVHDGAACVVHRRQLDRVLTQRQRQAYKNLAAQGYVILAGSGSGLWPPQAQATLAPGPVYAASTLRALVEAGVARWSDNLHYITHRPIGD